MRGSSRPHSSAGRVAALLSVAALALGCGEQPDALTTDRCAYPSAGYGYLAGDVPPPTLSWQGVDEAGGRSTVSIADYFDCDGRRGVNAILVDQSTAWCGVCRRLAARLAGNLHDGWRGRGVRVLSLITQNLDMSPATVETAAEWRRQFRIDGAVVADPSRSFRETAGEEAAPYPYEILIDPRTMKIVRVDAGFRGDGDFAPMLDLARRNASP